MVEYDELVTCAKALNCGMQWIYCDLLGYLTTEEWHKYHEYWPSW